MTLGIATLCEGSPPQKCLRWLALSRDHIVLPATDTFIHKWNEPHLTLGEQPKLVLIFSPQEGWKAELSQMHKMWAMRYVIP